MAILEENPEWKISVEHVAKICHFQLLLFVNLACTDNIQSVKDSVLLTKRLCGFVTFVMVMQ